MPSERPTVPARGHLAVVVPDFEATLERLRERGFEVEPGREHWGVPRARVIAPGGHRVELMAAPPSPADAFAQRFETHSVRRNYGLASLRRRSRRGGGR